MVPSAPTRPTDQSSPANIAILTTGDDSDLESEASTLPYDNDNADPVVDEHPTVWATLEDTHKVCSNTSSFTVPQVFETWVDVATLDSVYTTQDHEPSVTTTTSALATKPKRRNMTVGSKMTCSTSLTHESNKPETLSRGDGYSP